MLVRNVFFSNKMPVQLKICLIHACVHVEWNAGRRNNAAALSPRARIITMQRNHMRPCCKPHWVPADLFDVRIFAYCVFVCSSQKQLHKVGAAWTMRASEICMQAQLLQLTRGALLGEAQLPQKLILQRICARSFCRSKNGVYIWNVGKRFVSRVEKFIC